MTQHFVVVGLGFGDEGKGSIVEHLVCHTKANAVVRFNGGPQAAHHVVNADGGFHCFSQWGAGSFVPGVETHLSQMMFVEPLALLREAEILEEKGASSPVSRMLIDASCVIVTPFHRLLNRMHESIRGDGRHGSCGLGVGEAFMDTLKPGYPCVKMQDLFFSSVLEKKLKFLWMLKRDIADQMLSEHPHNDQLAGFYEQLVQDSWIDYLLEQYGFFAQQSGIQSADSKQFAKRWHFSSKPVVWEGAQGVLLDAERGFWPHVTPSRTTPNNARLLLKETKGNAKYIGVLRGYTTRHGAGPFIPESAWLTQKMPDHHNGLNAWQGDFRVGWFDCLMARYALRVAGNIDLLAITNLDRMAGLGRIKLCTAYRFEGPVEDELERYFIVDRTTGDTLLRDIRVPEKPSRAFQTELTRMLRWCRPVLRTLPGWTSAHCQSFLNDEEATPITRYLETLEAVTGASIGIVSFGPTAQDKKHLSSDFLSTHNEERIFNPGACSISQQVPKKTH